MEISSRFDNSVILLVSGIVLVFVFILTLVFGIIRIVKNAPTRVVSSTIAPTVLVNADEQSSAVADVNQPRIESDIYAVTEDIVKLTIELIATLFAILATFVLVRYIKGKYTAVPTRPN